MTSLVIGVSALPDGVTDAKGLMEHYRRVHERLGMIARANPVCISGIEPPKKLTRKISNRQTKKSRDISESDSTIELSPIEPPPADATERERIAYAIIIAKQLSDRWPHINKTFFIRAAVAASFDMSVSDLISPRRTLSIARPRMIAMAIARNLAHKSLLEISRYFGNRDHTTVLYACRKYGDLVSSVVAGDAPAGTHASSFYEARS